MKVSKKMIRDLITRDDLPSLLKVLKSLQREIAVKDELAEEYVSDANELRKAYTVLREERKNIVGKSKEYDAILAQFGGLAELPDHLEAARKLEELPEAVLAALEKLSD
jgi:phage gpG-like protein